MVKKLKILVYTLIIISLILFIIPTITTWCVSHDFEWFRGDVNTWIGFYGSIIGGVGGAFIGGMVAYMIAKEGIKEQRNLSEKLHYEQIDFEIEKNVKYSKYNRMLNEKDRIINSMQNCINDFIFLNSVCRKWEKLSGNDSFIREFNTFFNSAKKNLGEFSTFSENGIYFLTGEKNNFNSYLLKFNDKSIYILENFNGYIGIDIKNKIEFLDKMEKEIKECDELKKETMIIFEELINKYTYF